MITCKELAKKISSEEPMSLMQRLEVKLHIMICGCCQRFTSQMKGMGLSLRSHFSHFQKDHKQDLQQLKSEIKKKTLY